MSQSAGILTTDGTDDTDKRDKAGSISQSVKTAQSVVYGLRREAKRHAALVEVNCDTNFTNWLEMGNAEIAFARISAIRVS